MMPWIRVAGLCLVVACSHFEPHPEWVRTPSPEQRRLALSGDRLLGAAVDEHFLPEQALFDLTPEMKALAERLADLNRTHSDRAEALHRYLLGSPLQGGMGIRYSAYHTRSAADAFRERRVNCLSFTLIYVAMARHMGLDAQVNDVVLPPNWDLRKDGSVSVFRHVNAKVNLPGSDELVIDLEMERYSTDYEQKLISDREAAAQFYNNRAMEWLSQDETEKSFLNLRKALQLAPEASYIWNNLGILYRGNDEPELAETAFLQGLHLNPADWSVMSNLHQLYEHQQEVRKADYFEQRLGSYRENNPYYLHAKARQALKDGRLNAARKQIDEAIDREPDEARFYRLAEKIYQRMGRNEEAEAMASLAKKREQPSH